MPRKKDMPQRLTAAREFCVMRLHLHRFIEWLRWSGVEKLIPHYRVDYDFERFESAHDKIL